MVDPVGQEKLCSNQPVVFQCRIEQTALLRWRTPNGTLFYARAETIGTTKHTDNGKFTATLIENIPGSSPGISFLTSMLTVQPPLDVDGLNGSVIECEGNTIHGAVENTTIITLSGMLA